MRRIRLTGGEPLLRRGVVGLVDRLARHVAAGRLDEVTLTTNGTRLAALAAPLRAAGLTRVNVSLDSLSPAVFRRVTGGGDLGAVVEGVFAARAAGLAVRINAVALRGVVEHEVDRLIAWCGAHGFALSLIEPMPFGGAGGCRTAAPLPLDSLRAALAARWTLRPDPVGSAGPARYVTVAETGGRLGFITPLSHAFCHSCDRVRVSATGRLFPCLGHDRSVDLKPALRVGGCDLRLDAAIRAAVARKPARHPFSLDAAGDGPMRAMNVTGG